MAELTITAFISLDGVMQAPGAPDEDPSGGFSHGGWVYPLADEDFGKIMADVFTRADAFLLGRRTYEIFAAYWPKVSDPGDLIAAKLNTLPKFVASRTRAAFDWRGSEPVRDAAREVPALKKRYPREIQIHGSGDLAQTLIRHDLIDEYRLIVFPVLIGYGKRLFGAGSFPAGLSLERTVTTSKGAVLLVYRRAGDLKTGSFA